MDLPGQINDLKRKGRAVVGCFPLYPPVELFYSMGLAPVVLWGLRDSVTDVARSDRHLQNYVCSVGRHLTELVLARHGNGFDALFSYNACDTLRNLPELLAAGLAETGCALPWFHFHLPMVPGGQTDAMDYFAGEIKDLIGALERQFSRPFSETAFAQSVACYRTLRQKSLALGAEVALGRLGFAEFSKIVIQGHFREPEDQIAVLDAALGKASGTTGKKGIPVVLSGILPPPARIMDDLERAGLTVVGDDIALISRSFSGTPEFNGDPARHYADFYANHFPCPTLLTHGDRRAAALAELAETSGAAGVVFIGEKFCEYEYFEFPFLENNLEKRGVPALTLEISIDDREHVDGFRTRIEAFAEMLARTKTTD